MGVVLGKGDTNLKVWLGSCLYLYFEYTPMGVPQNIREGGALPKDAVELLLIVDCHCYVALGR